jgi:hypothetical protein
MRHQPTPYFALGISGENLPTMSCEANLELGCLNLPPIRAETEVEINCKSLPSLLEDAYTVAIGCSRLPRMGGGRFKLIVSGEGMPTPAVPTFTLELSCENLPRPDRDAERKDALLVVRYTSGDEKKVTIAAHSGPSSSKYGLIGARRGLSVAGAAGVGADRARGPQAGGP